MSKSFREARQEITGDSWLDDLARQSLAAAEAKFDRQSATACCPRETVPDSCSCPDGCTCLCFDCDCLDPEDEA
jgi:hypothetical protein